MALIESAFTMAAIIQMVEAITTEPAAHRPCANAAATLRHFCHNIERPQANIDSIYCVEIRNR